jgi:hypothetical protein
LVHPQPPRPLRLQGLRDGWHVVEGTDEKGAKLTLFGITPEDYQTQAENAAELNRFILDAVDLLRYYRAH